MVYRDSLAGARKRVVVHIMIELEGAKYHRVVYNDTCCKVLSNLLTYKALVLIANPSDPVN